MPGSPFITPERHRGPLPRFEEKFVAAWCFVMPVTGLVLLPSVQGTVPAYMMAFASVLFVFLRMQGGELPQAVLRYAKSALIILLLWVFFLMASQLGLLISDRHSFFGVEMIDNDDSSVVLRRSMFTQSLYLTACILIALYFRYFFKNEWMRYVFYGGYFLAGYGIYEWLYYLVFHRSGDFLANRTFGAAEHPGSWSQSINFGGLSLLRIKSTLGEPGFFAGVVLPFLFLALDYRKTTLAAMLIFTALFSTSTGCYLTLIACLFIKSIWTGRIKATHLAVFGLVIAFIVGLALFFPDNFYGMFAQKFSGDNNSGKMRLEGLQATSDLLASFNIGNWLFGIGFGYVYASVFVGFLLDTGILGLAIFLYVMFRPIIMLPIRAGSEGLKLGLLALAILFSLNLSELFLPPTWMFLGLAYNRLDQLKRARLAGYPEENFYAPDKHLLPVG